MSIIARDVIEIDPAVVAGWLADGEVLLVDVREDEEWAEERIHGAVLSPMSDFEADLFPTAPGKRLVVMCKVGKRSAAIARKMLQHGAFPVYNLAGGLNAWKESDLPTVR